MKLLKNLILLLMLSGCSIPFYYYSDTGCVQYFTYRECPYIDLYALARPNTDTYQRSMDYDDCRKNTPIGDSLEQTRANRYRCMEQKGYIRNRLLENRENYEYTFVKEKNNDNEKKLNDMKACLGKDGANLEKYRVNIPPITLTTSIPPITNPIDYANPGSNASHNFYQCMVSKGYIDKRVLKCRVLDKIDGKQRYIMPEICIQEDGRIIEVLK